MRTVRARLTWFTILAVAAILALMGGFVRYRVQANLVDEIDRQLLADTSSVKTGEVSDRTVSFNPPEGGETKEIRRGLAPKGETLMEVLRSQDSEVKLESHWVPPRLIPVEDLGIEHPDRPIEDPDGLRQAQTGKAAYHEFVKGKEPIRSLTAPVRHGGRVVAYVQAVRSMEPVRRQLADLDRALLMSIPVAVLLAALGGALLVGNAIRPLRRMTEAAHRLEDDLSESRLPAEGTDEFAELAQTINGAFDRTSAAFASQGRALAQLERFTGDAGHELRTPLASIKANASYLLHMVEMPEEHRRPIQTVDSSADRMAKLIDDLLLLARQDGGKAPTCFSEFSVEELVRSTVDLLAPRQGVSVQVSVDPKLVVETDQDAVERVLVNLLSNAVAYAHSKVVVSAELTDGFLSVQVSDDGDGISPEHIARLGERFYRPDEARSRAHGGVGLGLAIVKSLTEANGGSLAISSQVGTGTTVKARFATASATRR